MSQELNSMGSWKQQLSKYESGEFVKESNSMGGGIEKVSSHPMFFFWNSPK